MRMLELALSWLEAKCPSEEKAKLRLTLLLPMDIQKRMEMGESCNHLGALQVGQTSDPPS